jgi:murein L,D-transpeptidase YcbB/YkuD
MRLDLTGVNSLGAAWPQHARMGSYWIRWCAFALSLCSAGAIAGAALPWLDSTFAFAQALEAVTVLESAAEQGLDPADYDTSGLRKRLDRARSGSATPAERAELEEALTQSALAYLHDLRSGRIEPKQVGARFELPRSSPPDGWALLRDALSARRVGAALRDAQPSLPMYAALRNQLAHYRDLGPHAAWQQRLPAPARRKITPGDVYAGLPVLAQRLQALGDLPAGAVVGERYEGAMVDGVRSFQERHGLAADGVIGTATLQQLEVTPAARALQIALTMERLRWTPFMQGPRMVVINVPEFVLRAYEVNGERIDVRLTSRVVVGKAMDTRTPLFGANMRFVEFSPFWNVPPSIARKEIVPRLRRDPGYFDREELEFVTGAGQVVHTLSASNLDAVLNGGWRIRQRPGSHNALGGIKFVFPNNDNIYLHHTPATALFERERRDFSHGCVRVQKPLELAQFVLQDDASWTADRIREEMARGQLATVALPRPLPVLIAYATVIVRQGRVFFFDDIYHHDALLARVLEQQRNNRPHGNFGASQ